ncbi:hypothetical protein CAPTEDRAFT_205748 [Capitella teleta]|uniref:Uncharacterized protein n=1 Tax=Capitella teleta TaxID=283909 RepID=R7TX82_CAPTE|nr:hypothetical protein CAPTEDRAFT_205748 [Capitella teleta]|eukprot:ELT98543.1 hypothetical protein CAPTEDRAFT_205748 [Capitella teleta]
MDLKDINEEIKAFGKKLASCASSFIPQDLEFWLGYLNSSTVIDSGTRLRSLRHMRGVLVKLKSTRNQKHAKLFQYFEWLEKFLEYLRELRTIFTQRVLQPLQMLYSESDVDDVLVSFEGLNLDQSSLWSVKNLIHDIETNPGLSKEEMECIEGLETGGSSKQVLKNLESTVAHWGVYLNEDTAFDLDLLQVNHGGTERFIGTDVRYMLGLVDTVVQHCRCAEKEARKLVEYHGKNAMEDRMEKLRKVQTILDEKVSELDSQIKTMQIELDSQSDLFQRLLQREERSNELNAKLYEADTMLTSLKKKRESIQASGNKIEVINLDCDVRVAQYKVDLLRKDIDMEMEVKPSFRDIIRKSVIAMDGHPSSPAINQTRTARLQVPKERYEDRNTELEY